MSNSEPHGDESRINSNINDQILDSVAAGKKSALELYEEKHGYKTFVFVRGELKDRSLNPFPLVKKTSSEASRKKKAPKIEKQFPCPVNGCHSGYGRLCDLRSHFVEKHNEQLSKFPRLIPHDIFVCTLCDRSFSRRQSLARHNKVQHDVIADFPLKRPREESEPNYPRKRDRKLEQENFMKKVESYKECDSFPKIKLVMDLDEIPNSNSEKSSDDTDKLEEHQVSERISRKSSARNSGKVEIEFSTTCTQIHVQPQEQPQQKQEPESRGDVDKKIIVVENYFHSKHLPDYTCINSTIDDVNSNTNCCNNNNLTSPSLIVPDFPGVIPRKFSRVQEDFTDAEFSQQSNTPHTPQCNNSTLLRSQLQSQPTQLQPQPSQPPLHQRQTFKETKQKMSIDFLV